MRRRAAPLVALVLLATACSADTAEPAARSSSTPPPVVATATPSPATPSLVTEAVAVYYLRDAGPAGPRLYREFHALPVGDEPVRAAVEEMLRGTPDDADYTSLWPEGVEVLDVRVEGTAAVVDLSGEARDGQAGASFEQASLQQLVHTVTAVLPEVETVQLLVEGAPVESLWGHVDTSTPARRAPAAEVLGPVWVLEPVEGGRLKASGSVSGTASVFEATVSWQWLQDDEVVASGFATATDGAPGRGEWGAAIEVPPGDYVFRAFEESAEDGRPLFVDDKRVTVVEG